MSPQLHDEIDNCPLLGTCHGPYLVYHQPPGARHEVHAWYAPVPELQPAYEPRAEYGPHEQALGAAWAADVVPTTNIGTARAIAAIAARMRNFLLRLVGSTIETVVGSKGDSSPVVLGEAVAVGDELIQPRPETCPQGFPTTFASDRQG